MNLKFGILFITTKLLDAIIELIRIEGYKEMRDRKKEVEFKKKERLYIRDN